MRHAEVESRRWCLALPALIKKAAQPRDVQPAPAENCFQIAPLDSVLRLRR